MKLSNLFNNFLGKWRTRSVPKRFAWLSLIAFIIIVVIRIATEGLANPILDPFIVNAATIIALLMTVIGFLYPEKPQESTVVVPPSEPLTSTSAISGYDQDIFVSFAPTDKEWATNLVNTLQNGPLKVRVGKSKSCSVWMADEASQALDILEHTATLLLVLSPDWVKSSDCSKVLQTFLQYHHDLSRVVVVTRQPVELPAELQGCQLYQLGDSPAYKPVKIEPRFYNQVVTLAKDLANKLTGLRHPVAPPKTTVFLAEVTDDLEDSRHQLKSVLEQEGCRVLPQGTALFTEHPETRWQADLAQASVFIQLLSRLPGKQNLPQLQYQLAQTAKVKILQWHDKQLNLDQVTHSQHKTLLESNTVMAIGIEEFRQEVLRVIKPREETPTEPRLLAQPIFVNTSPEDENFGKQIIQLLDKHKVHGTVPLYQGKPTQIRKDIKAKMSFCRAMVLVYGQAGLGWVNAQHCDFNQICKQTGNTCLPPLALCHLPENPEFVTSGIDKFSCTGNLEQDLSHFLNQYQLKPHA
jgi:hypothetical protein